MTLEKIIAANLVYYMTINRENQTDLAKAVKTSAHNISQYVCGRAKPKLETLVTISQHYGCTLDDLCTLKIRLKPCPFCGNEANLSSVSDHLRIVVDHKSGCYLDGDNLIFPSKEEAAEAWNKRV